MINKILVTIALFFLCKNIVAQTLPDIPDLSTNAKDELIDLVNIIFEKEKQQYGFADTDNVNQIVIGKKFLLYYIPSKHIEILNTCSNVKDMADKGFLNTSIQSILYVNDRPVCLIEYYKKAGWYHIGGIRSTGLVSKLSYVINHCENPIIITSYLKNVWYFSDVIDDYIQLHPLDSVSNTGLGKTAVNSKNIFSLLNEILTLSNKVKNR